MTVVEGHQLTKHASCVVVVEGVGDGQAHHERMHDPEARTPNGSRRIIMAPKHNACPCAEHEVRRPTTHVAANHVSDQSIVASHE